MIWGISNFRFRGNEWQWWGDYYYILSLALREPPDPAVDINLTLEKIRGKIIKGHQRKKEKKREIEKQGKGKGKTIIRQELFKGKKKGYFSHVAIRRDRRQGKRAKELWSHGHVSVSVAERSAIKLTTISLPLSWLGLQKGNYGVNSRNNLFWFFQMQLTAERIFVYWRGLVWFVLCDGMEFEFASTVVPEWNCLFLRIKVK